jgi:hypothetical protein
MTFALSTNTVVDIRDTSSFKSKKSREDPTFIVYSERVKNQPEFQQGRGFPLDRGRVDSYNKHMIKNLGKV